MADKNQSPNDATSPEEQTDEEALRRRLVGRIAIAGVVIVALLGGLAVIDAMYTPSPSPSAQVPPYLPMSHRRLRQRLSPL